MGASRAFVVLVLTWVGLACVPEAPAQIEVTVSPDEHLRGITRVLRVRVEQGGLPEQVEEQPQPVWPARLVVPQLVAPDADGGGDSMGLSVTVEALDTGGQPVGYFRLDTGFVPNAVRYVHVVLGLGCATLTLPAAALPALPDPPALSGNACLAWGKRWREPIEVDAARSVDVLSPGLVALDAVGGGVVAWSERAEGGSDARVARYRDGAWTASESLTTPGGRPGVARALSTDAGDAVVLWWESRDYPAWYATRSTAEGWGLPVGILDVSLLTGVVGPVIAQHASGEIASVYGLVAGRGSSLNGGRTSLTGERRWQSVPLMAEFPSILSGPDIVLDEDGVITLAWVQNGDLIGEVRTTRWAADQAGWHDPFVVESGDFSAAYPRLALGRLRSHPLLVWSTANNGVRWSRFESATSWTEASVIPGTAGVAGVTTRLAADAVGNAVLLWSDADQVWASFFEAMDGNWSSEPVRLTDSRAIEVTHAEAAVSPLSAGGAAVWAQAGVDGREVWTRRFELDGTLGDLVRLDHAGAGESASPSVAVAPDGAAAATWREHDGTRFRLWSARFE